MFNGKELKMKMIQKGVGADALICALGVNESTFYRKLAGKSEFSRSEIQIIRATLKLTVEEADLIFFAPELA